MKFEERVKLIDTSLALLLDEASIAELCAQSQTAVRWAACSTIGAN